MALAVLVVATSVATAGAGMVSDVTGDGALDAVFANGFGGGESNRLCVGDGFGGLSCDDIAIDAGGTQGVALGHVDTDEYLDAVFAGSPADSVWLGDAELRVQ